MIRQQLAAFKCRSRRSQWWLPQRFTEGTMLPRRQSATSLSLTSISLRLLGACALLLVSSCAAFAIDKCGASKRYTCVVDGDTIWLKGEKIRIMGYDTPEPFTNICGGERERLLAEKASDRLIELLSHSESTIERRGQDRYGRTLAVIRVDGVSVGDILISEGLARSWPDGHEFWCE